MLGLSKRLTVIEKGQKVCPGEINTFNEKHEGDCISTKTVMESSKTCNSIAMVKKNTTLGDVFGERTNSMFKKNNRRLPLMKCNNYEIVAFVLFIVLLV